MKMRTFYEWTRKKAYDSLTVGERFETIQEWRKSLTREEIKELSKWVDLIYFAKVKEETNGIHET